MREDQKMISDLLKEFRFDILNDKKNSKMFYDKAKEADQIVRDLTVLIDNYYMESHRNKEGNDGMNWYIAKWLAEKKKEFEAQYNKFARLHNYTLKKDKQFKELDLGGAKLVPIPEIMGVQYKTGSKRVQMFCCPLHNEKTPSFAWYPEKNRWHCFGACQKSGDAIDLFMQLNNTDFITSVKELNKY